MKYGLIGAATATALGLATATAHAGDPSECREVGFSNVNWTGVTVKTETVAWMLEELGYETQVTTASVPISFQAVASGERDAFFGLWLPTQRSMIEPHFESGDLEKVVANLEGAKYTLAVPQYVYDAGVTHFEDLDEHADRFESRFYGIEAGNDGNEMILDMIDDDAYSLGDWELMESSEAGMLTQVDRAIDREEWVVYLGWAPHPMNTNFDMAYLHGGEDYFGPDQGGATVYTLATTGYTEQCPNVGRLLEQFTVSVEEQSIGQSYVTDDEMDYAEAGRALIQDHPELLERWLDGVTTFDGERDAVTVIRESLNL